MRLPRIHFIELHDTEATPRFLRKLLTDTLVAAWSMLRYFDLAGDLLATCLKATKQRRIVDLCSGSGGPLPFIQRSLARKGVKLSVTLTDLFPNPDEYHALKEKASAAGVELTYSDTSVDATACSTSGFRTIFGTWHHFPPAVAQKMLQNVVDTHSSIAIFEATERSIFNVFFFYTFLAPPFISLYALYLRPSLTRFLFTFIFPLLPFIFWFDGVVSCLRTYNPDEMHQLIKKVKGSEHYQWICGIKRDLLVPNLVYYIGLPKDASLPLRSTPNGSLVLDPVSAAHASKRLRSLDSTEYPNSSFDHNSSTEGAVEEGDSASSTLDDQHDRIAATSQAALSRVVHHTAQMHQRRVSS